MAVKRDSTGVFKGVQILRFVAAGLVLVTHSFFYTRERLDPAIPMWSPGEVGVDIFFVISGFVMYLSAKDRSGQKPDWMIFAIKRVLRIFPMYWAATIVNIVAILILPGMVLHSDFSIGTVLKSFLLIPAVNAEGRVEPIVGPGWTLYFETMFYAVVTVALIVRRSPLIIASTVLSILAIGFFLIPNPRPPELIYFSPVVLEFLFGMLIAKFVPGRGNAVLAGMLIVIGFIGCVTLQSAFPDILKILTRGIPALTLVAGVVMFEPYLSNHRLRSWLVLGEASYVLYLFHPIIAPAVPVAFAIVGLSLGWLSILLSIIIAIAVTTVLYLLIDRPMLRMSERVIKDLVRRRSFQSQRLGSA